MKYAVNELYRFRMLMAGVYVGLGVSSTYGFSIFTEHLRSRYGFNQSDITTISTVGNCVGFLSFFSGMLFDFGGPKAVYPIAGTLAFLGFLLFGLSFDDVIKPYDSRMVNMILFCIFNAMLYLGCPAMDGATMMPLMLNFPLERGYMVIIQKTFSGLGTTVLMAYFNGWFADTTSRENSNFAGYAYFVGCHILLVAFLGFLFVDFPPYFQSQFVKKRLTEEDQAERAATLPVIMGQHAPMRRIYIGVALVIIDLVFLTVSSIVSAYVPTTKGGYVAISVIAVFLLACFSILAMPFQFLGGYPVIKKSTKFPLIGWTEDADGDNAGFQELDGERADEDAFTPIPHQPTPAPDTISSPDDDAAAVTKDDPALLHVGEAVAGADEAVKQMSNPEDEEEAPKVSSVAVPQHQGSFWRHLLTVDLWLLWFCFFGMWGTGSIMQMNAAQIYRSTNHGVYDAKTLSLYVALMGVGSAIGRIVSGVVDMKLSQWKAEGRTKILTTIFLPVGAGLMTLGYLFFAVLPAAALILPFIVTSLGNGIAWGLGVLAVRIMYAQDIGKHYNFMFSSGFVCTIALNRFMFGGMYDNEAKRLKTAPACNAPSCVRNQMFILMAVNALATVTAVIAHIRFTRFVAKHQHQAVEEEPQAQPVSSSEHSQASVEPVQ